MVGLGSDQLVEAELVTAEGAVLTVSADGVTEAAFNGSSVHRAPDEDLFWAIRGGGGSVWGVITSLTLKTHELPTTGFTLSTAGSSSTMCGSDKENLLSWLQGYFAWAAKLDNNWSGLVQIHSHVLAKKDNNTFPASIGLQSCKFWASLYGGCESVVAIANSPNCRASAACEANPAVIWQYCPETCGITAKCDAAGAANAGWYALILYNYRGSPSDAEYTRTWSRLTALVDTFATTTTHVDNYWEIAKDYSLETLYPVHVQPGTASAVGGIPSVLLSHDMVASEESGLAKFVYNDIASDACISTGTGCGVAEFYQDIPGTVTPIAVDSAVSDGFRKAEMHYVAMTPGIDMKGLYDLGNYSYFAESAYYMEGTGWQERYWGNKYVRLVAAKNKWDPTHAFWCHNCVGADL